MVLLELSVKLLTMIDCLVFYQRTDHQTKRATTITMNLTVLLVTNTTNITQKDHTITHNVMKNPTDRTHWDQEWVC